eukprot:5884657-Lingulodinium_polyedra.AAC.1
MAKCKEIDVQEFREGLGRLGFAAGPLLFVRPFVAPLRAWVAVVGDKVEGKGKAQAPPLIRYLL